MTTELLFRSDAYLKTAQAQVIAVHERGIELDRTIFYPMGGGQMGDSGVLLRALTHWHVEGDDAVFFVVALCFALVFVLAARTAASFVRT